MKLLIHRFSVGLWLLCTLVAAPLAVPEPASAISIAARVADQSTEAAPMDRVYFDVEIKYPENLTRKDLRITAELKQGGQVIATAKSLRAVETQTSFLDYIVVPENVEKGTTELNVIVEDYEGMKKEVSATFQVVGDGDKLQLYFFILLGAMVVIGLAVSLQITLLARRRAAKI